MNVVERLHERYVKSPRVSALVTLIEPLVPPNSSILDVGCGDGLLAEALRCRRPDVRIAGIDVMARPDARITVTVFEGDRLPFAENAFDVVFFIDVLHHTPHAEALLRDARAIARHGVIVKDHCADALLAWPTLKFMDSVGNARFDVALPHLYLTWSEWQGMFARLGLRAMVVRRKLGLYPRPFSWVFERSLHFLALLKAQAV